MLYALMEEARQLTFEEKNNKLLEVISSKYPGFLKLVNDGDITEVARTIRDFAHFSFLRSSDQLFLDNYGKSGDNLHPYEKYLLFQAKEIGVLCGGAAKYLADIYNALGYSATCYNYGLSDSHYHHTHVVTIVKCREGMLIQDAYFNVEYFIRKQGPADFAKLLRYIRSGDFADIETVQYCCRDYTLYHKNTLQGKMSAVDSLTCPAHWHPQLSESFLSHEKIICHKSNVAYTYASYVESYKDSIYNLLAEKTGASRERCNPLSFMTYPCDSILQQKCANKSSATQSPRTSERSSLVGC